MPRQSTPYLFVLVMAYVAVVNSVACLVIDASISPHASPLADEAISRSFVARTDCRDRQIAFSQAGSRGRAIRDHDACPPHRRGTAHLP
jgi:hypothetical protein